MKTFKQYEEFKSKLTEEQLADFDGNRRFIEVAMHMQIIRDVDLKYTSYLDEHGHAELYELSMVIVDKILYSDNSEFLKYWKLYVATDGEATQDYFSYVFDTCMDWYFIDLASKELEVELVGYESNENNTIKREEVAHRMKMILDDLKVVKDLFSDEALFCATKYAENLETHFNNIEIACDLEDSESLDWTEYGSSKPKVEEKGVMHPKVEEIIETLRTEVEVDGETIQYIVESVGMEEQIFNQLLNCYPNFRVNEDYHIKDTAERVWNDIYNNETLTFNSFDEYWEYSKNSLLINI